MLGLTARAACRAGDVMHVEPRIPPARGLVLNTWGSVVPADGAVPPGRAYP